MQMLWRLFGQQPRLDAVLYLPLAACGEHGPQPGDRLGRAERLLAHERPGPPETDGPYRKLARALWAYNVFPPRLLTGIVPRTPLQPGDTFGSCFHVLPGVDLFFAGRVTHTFDEFADGLWRAGLAFHTVQGHPAIGEESFLVEKEPATGAVRVRIESWSRPGLWWTRRGRTFMERVQTWAVNSSLNYLFHLARR